MQLIANVSQLLEEQHNSRNRIDIAVLLLAAVIGMLCNFALFAIILGVRRLRQASNAFVCHQCLLDLVKSAYCLVFAQSIDRSPNTVWCGVIGGSYIVIMTSSAFNLLAMVMNEAYHLADQTLDISDSRSCCCVIFGVFIIWFGSLIVHLGVAFIPGNLSFNRVRGRCIFTHGVTQNFVLQMLWVFLISLAMILTIMYLHKLHVDIRRMGYYRLSTLVRTTFKINPAEGNQCQESRDRHHIAHVQKLMRRKLVLLVSMTTIFIAFWFPLFILSAVDWKSQVDEGVYRALTILAWSNSTISPLILMLFIKIDSHCPSDEDVPPPTLETRGPLNQNMVIE